MANAKKMGVGTFVVMLLGGLAGAATCAWCSRPLPPPSPEELRAIQAEQDAQCEQDCLQPFEDGTRLQGQDLNDCVARCQAAVRAAP
jgi:hypothetical protein